MSRKFAHNAHNCAQDLGFVGEPFQEGFRDFLGGSGEGSLSTGGGGSTGTFLTTEGKHPRGSRAHDKGDHRSNPSRCIMPKVFIYKLSRNPCLPLPRGKERAESSTMHRMNQRPQNPGLLGQVVGVEPPFSCGRRSWAADQVFILGIF